MIAKIRTWSLPVRLTQRTAACSPRRLLQRAFRPAGRMSRLAQLQGRLGEGCVGVWGCGVGRVAPRFRRGYCRDFGGQGGSGPQAVSPSLFSPLFSPCGVRVGGSPFPCLWW